MKENTTEIVCQNGSHFVQREMKAGYGLVMNICVSEQSPLV